MEDKEQISLDETIASQFIWNSLGLMHVSELDPITKVMIDNVDAIKKENPHLRTDIISKINSYRLHDKEGFKRVTTDMFDDGIFNWGRIVMVFYLADVIANHFITHHVMEWLKDFLSDKESQIKKIGGWNEFLLVFGKRLSWYNRLYTNIIKGVNLSLYDW